MTWEAFFTQFGLGTPFGYASMAFSLFSLLDLGLSDRAKSALAKLASFGDYDGEEVSAALIEVFDRLYSAPLLSARAFVRSVIFTLMVTGLFVLESRSIISLSDGLAILSFTISTATNVISDYVSLFVIRPWLGYLGYKPVLALVSGGMIGLVIVNFAAVFRMLIILGLAFAIFPRVTSNSPALFSLAFALPGMIVFSWLPLLAFGLLATRAVSAATWLLGKTQLLIKDGDKHSLTIFGGFAAILVFVIATLWHQIFQPPPMILD